MSPTEQTAVRDDVGVDSDAFDAMRRLYSAADDQPRLWWYAAEQFVTPDGWPTLHLLTMRAILACRSRMVTPDEMHVEFVEIGAFVDPTTRQPAVRDWVNPITRLPTQLPTQIFDTFGHYRVRRLPDAIEMVTIGGQRAVVDVRYRESAQGGMLEYERRRLVPGGTATYVQSMFADRAALRDRKAVSVPAWGVYENSATVLPAYAGLGPLKGHIRTRGSLLKSDMGVVMNPESVRLIQPIFPDWFPNGVFTPIWRPLTP